MQQNRDRYFKLADELLALTKDMNIPEDIREKVTKATISKKLAGLSDGLREAAKEDKSEYDRQLKQKKMHKNLPIELLQQSVKSKFRSQNNQQLQPRPHKLSQ
ncbi:hypothetical protein K6V78_10005 [Streptococcus gallolyticus]|nr:hypothetical protein [Streptococcus gallolyticus]MBY5041869.1 hypothetical protein [Streptococcus gallolyticus]